MQQCINWRRIERAIHQEARRLETPHRAEVAIRTLKQLVERCGPTSTSRTMCVRIGKLLVREHIGIVVPCCPDYSHEDGVYTFRDVGGGVTLLTRKHIPFLEGLTEYLPDVDVLFLLADHEVDDHILCERVGKAREEFLALIEESVESTRQAVAQRGWEVKRMTDWMPDLVHQEAEVSRWISGPEFETRIQTETLQRSDMYRRINAALTNQEMMDRTIKTAAQYVAMGRCAEKHGMLLANHTTTNLSWYLQTNAAVLHNPVSVY